MYQPTGDVSQAEAFALGLGIAAVRYDDPAVNDPQLLLTIANNVNEGLDFLRQRGVAEVPDRVEVNRQFFLETNRRATAWAAYVHDAMLLQTRTAWPFRRAILLNPRPEWAIVAQSVATDHQRGHLSTSDRHHYLYHEYGHFLWRWDNPSRNRTADQQLFWATLKGLRPHLSGQARASLEEFVSEVFVQYVVGNLPDPSVQQLYLQLGGRVL